jgi:hypothetical protein
MRKKKMQGKNKGGTGASEAASVTEQRRAREREWRTGKKRKIQRRLKGRKKKGKERRQAALQRAF